MIFLLPTSPFLFYSSLLSPPAHTHGTRETQTLCISCSHVPWLYISNSLVRVMKERREDTGTEATTLQGTTPTRHHGGGTCLGPPAGQEVTAGNQVMEHCPIQQMPLINWRSQRVQFSLREVMFVRCSSPIGEVKRSSSVCMTEDLSCVLWGTRCAGLITHTHSGGQQNHDLLA